MLFNQDNFQQLSAINSSDTPCVSIFIPTYRAGHTQEDRIRFKNAVAEAKGQLQNNVNSSFEKMTEKEAKGFLTPAYDLIDKGGFWQHQSDGLAVFIGKDLFEYYQVPINFDPLVYTNNHYFLRPLMPLLNKNYRFFLLALSRGEVRFYEGHRYSITPVKIEDLVPENFAEAMSAEDPEKTLQHHGSGDGTVYHGHGLHKDQKDWQIKEYCRMVDDGLMKMLHDESAPMIIAGTDEMVAEYKNISDYRNVVDAHVSGNVENDDPALLHEKAWERMKSYFDDNIKTKKQEFDAAKAENKASSGLRDIVPAAISGRVGTLFLAHKLPVMWGQYNEKTNTIDLHDNQQPDSVCVANLAAVRTVEQGGQVYHTDQSEVPYFTETVNAIYRY